MEPSKLHRHHTEVAKFLSPQMIVDFFFFGQIPIGKFTELM